MSYKNMRCSLRRPDDSGIVLVAVLWVTVVLSAIVFVIGRWAQKEIYFAKYQIGSTRSRAYVWSGLFVAHEKLKKWSALRNDVNSAPEGRQPLADFIYKPFQQMPLDGGYFRISNPVKGESSAKAAFQPWFQDEADRINLNGLGANNYSVLQELLMVLGVKEDAALNIARSVVDWKDPDNDVFGQGEENEDDLYINQTRPYKCKNRPFDSFEELVLVRGMTAEIMLLLEPYVTVFPRTGELSLNLDTAPKELLLAFARALSGPRTNTGREDADSLVKKISDYRDRSLAEMGSPGRKIDYNNMELNSKEKAIYFALISYGSAPADALRFDIRGADTSSGVVISGQFVIDLRTSNVLSWQRSGS